CIRDCAHANACLPSRRFNGRRELRVCGDHEYPSKELRWSKRWEAPHKVREYVFDSGHHSAYSRKTITSRRPANFMDAYARSDPMARITWVPPEVIKPTVEFLKFPRQPSCIDCF